HLQQRCPARTYAILEAREAMGGTWDLFRYPGIRSDSDMYTFGYAFRPWTGGKVFADGPSIRDYIESTARDNGIDAQIRFGHRVVSADWDSEEGLWTVIADHGGDHGHDFLEHLAAFLLEQQVPAGARVGFGAVEKAEVIADVVGELRAQFGAEDRPDRAFATVLAALQRKVFALDDRR
ncbi:MAG: hypothetical protein ACPH9E_15120, partial [Hyphomonas sp.]